MTGVGVFRSFEDPLDASLFDNLSARHHTHPIGNTPNHAEIVGDEEQPHPELGLQFLQQGQDLSLDRDVEGRGRFICNQQLGIIAIITR
jgi:hypothetical protein